MISDQQTVAPSGRERMMVTPTMPTRPVYCLPRLDRLYHRLAFQRQPSRIDMQLLRNLLAEYGVSIQGSIEIPGGPGRSDNVIIETSAGKKMLKRYKSTVEPAAVRHEHSILRYLQRVEFPAPRVVPTVNGETLLQRAGQYYALFDVLQGYYQYHNYLFLPAQTEDFIRLSGRALACLHLALKNFTPDGRHPNGFKSRQEDRWRELSWYIEQLDQCQQQASQLQSEQAHVLIIMLSRYGGWVRENLYRLDTMLRAAAPPRLIIHGDYGPYNLFFKPGEPIVILDFELARLDWRLTDLSTALPSFARSRLGFNGYKMKCFLEGYQSTWLLAPEELLLLPSVWQFLTLRRVIVCWRRYCSSQALQWLIEAQQRLSLARWLETNELSLCNWLMH